MSAQNMPDRERWSGWVALAWTFALLAIVGGIAVIATTGFIEVPRLNSFDRTETSTEPNVFIWTIAIGQAVSFTMLAAIFSMINSIYQNSCDQLEEVDLSQPSSKQVNTPKNSVLRLTSVPATSSLSKTLSTGDIIITFNGQPVTSLENDVVDRIVTGENSITFLTLEGEEKTVTLFLNHTSFNGIQGQMDQLRTSMNTGDGLKVVSIHSASQLEGILHPNYVLLSINDQLALSEMDAAKAVVNGENKIEFINSKGDHQVNFRNMKPGPLHIQFET
ncbi:hypothetical protein [Vreelandella neptunia]|uniref:PDZ domain-containing protein n=1 Tax=Vreelandella neptunia TaxID=115551 RepID=A0ABZ0YJV4_9GAMM|nr:hypothetical protein [Halomonas neptunia]MDN3562717.1 hypothetical protein [Halomonas neptunia]WQH12376.1 hypothetical protein SR894_19840 [Halomonas neptunia]